jgi:glutamine amidotransferase
VCRVVAYVGRPINLETLLFETDSSLVEQVCRPQMTTSINLAGFGMVAWDDNSERPEEPFVYRTTTLPMYDRNLHNLARKIRPRCLVAHIRGANFSQESVVAEQNVHPFRFPGVHVALAHNGHLRGFSRMRPGLAEHLRPDVATSMVATIDSEWIYAIVLSQLDDPWGEPQADELVEAIAKTLRIIRQVRREQGIDTSSPVNLFATTGRCLVATRFSFDYGWYPPGDPFFEMDLPYVSLWYTLGGEYVHKGDTWEMVGDGNRDAQAFLIASEPLTHNTSRWLEVPEYSVVSATARNGTIETTSRELDA